MTTENSKETQTENRKSFRWLQKLKDESWEAELLISTVAIFGSFQLFKVIDWATNIFIDYLPPNQYIIGYFIVFFSLLAVSFLLSMFLIHFVMRAYWIGLLGLNSVFPDYNIENSAYSPIYTQKMIDYLPKIKDTIPKIDEICSVIFSMAFSFLMMYLYISISSSIYVLLYNLLDDYVPSYILLIPVGIMAIFMLGQIIIGLIAQLKIYKENEMIQTLYFKSVVIGNYLVIGPLSKSIMQIFMLFGSNYKNKKYLSKIAFPLLIVSLIFCLYETSETNILYLFRSDTYFTDKNKAETAYYAEEKPETKFLLNPEIESSLIHRNTFRLFIPIMRNEKSRSDSICPRFEENKDLSNLENRMLRDQYRQKCYEKYHHIQLDNKPLEVPLLKHNHPKNNQVGVLAFIDVQNLEKGIHRLKVTKNFGEEDLQSWEIPFYYEPENQ